MTLFKKLANHLGIDWEAEEEGKATYEPKAYEGKDLPRLKLHRDYLKSIESDENNRLNTIEAKTSQLLSHTGLIFALLSLFIPLIFDKIDLVGLKVVLLIVLFSIFALYSLATYNAAKNYFIKKFYYARASEETVINLKDEGEADFLVVEIRDLLFCIRANSRLTNIKGRNLNYSYIAFKNANMMSGILVIILCVSMLFWPAKKEAISIQNPIRVENCGPA